MIDSPWRRTAARLVALSSLPVSGLFFWTAWLLYRQLEKAHAGDITITMVSKGLGGTPGIVHTATTLLVLVITITVLLALSIALAGNTAAGESGLPKYGKLRGVLSRYRGRLRRRIHERQRVRLASRIKSIKHSYTQHGRMERPDNLGFDGRKLSGDITIRAHPGGIVSAKGGQIAGSIGLWASTLPNPDRIVEFSGRVADSPADATRWRIAWYPFGAEGGGSLPWYLPDLLSRRQRDDIEHHCLDMRPLPDKLAEVVRAAACQAAGRFSNVSFRDGEVWAHSPDVLTA